MVFKHTKSIDAATLASIAVFSELDLEARQKIAPLLSLRQFTASQYIISSSQSKAEVYFLLSGSVRVCAFSEDGKQVQFGELKPGMMFGEMSVIDGGARSSDCIAIQESMVACISAEQFRTTIHAHSEVADAVLFRLVSIIRAQMSRVYEFSTAPVKTRVRLELLRMASEHATDKTEVIICPAPTHADIASRISTHREAVTRELKALEAQGVITWRPGSHIIHDVARLTEQI